MPSIYVPNLKFPASVIPKILGGSQNSKNGSRDYDPFLSIFCIFFISNYWNSSMCQSWSLQLQSSPRS